MSSIHVTNVKDASGNAALVTESGGVKTDKLTGITAEKMSLSSDGNLTVSGTINGSSLGTASSEFSNLFLADAGIIYFGSDQDIQLKHKADVGLEIKNTNTADDKPTILTLASGETDIAANDVIGAINFQAPDEGTGTDAILVAAGIEAVSEGDFSSSSNATKLSFKTGASEAAAEKMSLSSAGLLTIADDFVIKDGGTIGSASDTDAISISSGGVVNISATTANTSASDGALTVAGGLGVAADASIGDDLRLISDAAVLSFGADSDVTLTHVADTGILLNSTMAIQFNDASQFINAPSATVLDVNATDEIELNATLVDVNANVEISGTTAQVGVSTSTAKDVFNAGLSVKNGSTSAGFVEFFEDSDNGTNKLTLIGPASSGDITVTLPSSAGTVALTTDIADEATALAIALG